MSLKDHWYIAAESSELGKEPLARVVFGEPLALFRAGGRPAAVTDRCAHRNMALSAGKVCGERLQCGYHGWSYDELGVCRFVPALGQEAELPRIAVRSYPVVEQDGYLWVWLGKGPASRRPFRFPHLGEQGWTSFTMRNTFAGNVENCLENFLDCPHTVFVHKGWFRTPDARSLSAVVSRAKDAVEARFDNEPLSPSLVTWLLFPKGRELRHTDHFQLPSISRVDYDFGLDRHFIIASQCTPVSETETRVHTVVNFRFGRIGALVRLFFEPLCRRIIAQDRDIIEAQGRQLARFKGPQFTHLETDLLGPQIRRLRRTEEEGSPAEEPETARREVTIRF